ncbi:MAG: hypothetical protein QCI82_07190 [Candidatus Thermoplasmatota archaeon]|nr:hypothetical protein [Candidatus Thermoplasmatota archaeon]
MADDDKKHQKRLKEARKVLEKNYRLYQEGKITTDELKEKLRPYKAELIELKLLKPDKAEERPPEAVEARTMPLTIRAGPWKRTSTLTEDEVRRRIDQISSRGPSDGLKEVYRQRFGEDLSPPSEKVLFEIRERAAEAPEEEQAVEEGPRDMSDRSKGFLKTLFKRGR